MKYNISARGILRKGTEILLVEYEDTSGKYYSLPGGTQNIGESLAAAVVREFKEETSLDIVVDELLIIREFILKESDIKTWENGIHQVEAIFICDFKNKDQNLSVGSVPDHGMLDIKWIDIKDFKNYRIYPTQDLPDILENKNVTYLFTEN